MVCSLLILSIQYVMFLFFPQYILFPIFIPFNLVVSWKKPRNLDLVDAADYEPSWLVAENLDQHSLAAAFQMFPADADPIHVEVAQKLHDEEGGQSDIDDGFSEDEEEEDEESGDDGEGVEDDASSFEDDIQDYDNAEDDNGGSKPSSNVADDPNISHLEDSGTSKVVVKRAKNLSKLSHSY